MVEREGYNLRFTDDVLDIDQTDLGAAAVKRYLSVITHYENLSLGNDGRDHVVAVVSGEGCSLDIRLGNLDAVNNDFLVFVIKLKGLTLCCDNALDDGLLVLRAV